jgi:hypothetical protein
VGGGEPAGHHIREVIDYFLSDEEATVGLRARPAEGTCYRFGVTAPGRGWLSAFACAHLARASLPLPGKRAAVRVRVEERHDQPWSVEPFLGGTRAEHLGSLFRGGGGRAVSAAFRIPVGIELGAGERGAHGADFRDSGGGTVVTWLHLGRFPAAAGGRPAAGGGELSPAAPLPRAVDGLVWCATAAEATGMRGAYELGAALATVAPAQLKLLLFSAAWAGPAGPRDGRTPPSGDGLREGTGSVDVARCAALARAAAGDIPLEVIPVDGGPEWLVDEQGEAAAGCDRLFRRLVASLEQGAASLRRMTASAGRIAEARP